MRCRLPILALVCVGVLSASAITIQNQGFETANLGGGTFSQLVPGSSITPAIGSLSNWTAISTTSSAAAGAFDPPPGANANNWSTKWWTGNNMAYLQVSNSGTVSLSQTLSSTLQDDTLYTLSALVGRRGFTGTLNYSLQLWAGNTLLSSAGSLALPKDSFASDSTVYASGANDPNFGQPLMIVLASTYASAGTEAFFDDITLNAVANVSATPEPSTFLLVSIGLFAAGLLRIRSRSSLIPSGVFRPRRLR